MNNFPMNQIFIKGVTLMRNPFIILLILLGWVCLLPFSEGAVTIPDEMIEEHPIDLVLPRDFPLPISESDIKAEGIKILVFGDSGTGDEIQWKVAKAMQAYCASQGCHLGLMLGDNIHPAGVASASDPQFIEKFEKPYSGLGFPIFAILGEHDWGRKGNMSNWRAQIEYTQKSKTWRMPSDVYSIIVGNIKIIALNTNYFQASKIQKVWLRKELEESKARWNLVMGHKPIYSYGYHGDTDFLIDDMLPLLCEKADLYLAAHEHKQQVLKAECGLPLLVSGAAGKLRPEEETGSRALFNLPESGFAYLRIKKDEMVIQVLSADGKIRYELIVSKDPAGKKVLKQGS
jgi:tartrate-resistant acid phosphatase type 5